METLRDDGRTRPASRAGEPWRAGWWAVHALLALAAAAWYVVGEWRAFLNLHFYAKDYALYDNLLWNIAHGRGFYSAAIDGSYLSLHLSPSLALLAPLYRIWDTPLWPIIVQSAALGAGGLLLAEWGRRLGAPPGAALLLSLIYCLEPLAQRTYLDEFHFVALQAPLIFAFAVAVLGRRNVLAFALAAVLLGTREDAFVGLTPLCFLLAWRLRSRAAAATGAFSLLYGGWALRFGFSWFGGSSLLERRAGELELLRGEVWRMLLDARRYRNLYLLLPHALPALFAGPWVLAAAAPLAQTLLSGQREQYHLMYHYPALFRPYLYLAMAAGTARLAAVGAGRLHRALPAAVLLASGTAALWLTLHEGPLLPFLPGSPRAYGPPAPRHLDLYGLIARIPPDASVASPDHIFSHLSHRPRLWRYRRKDSAAYSFPAPEYYLLDSRRKDSLTREELRRLVIEEDYSLAAVAGGFALLRRSGGAARFKDYRDLFYTREAEESPSLIGRAVRDEEASMGIAMEAANGAGGPQLISYGTHWNLEGGTYVCLLRVRNPSPDGEGAGLLEAVTDRGTVILAQKGFSLEGEPSWTEVSMPLKLDGPTRVEIRVAVGGGSSLRADRIVLDGPGLREEFERFFSSPPSPLRRGAVPHPDIGTGETGIHFPAFSSTFSAQHEAADETE